MGGIGGKIVVIGFPAVDAALHADAEQAIWFTQSYKIGRRLQFFSSGE
jgi:hypothetical protein